jgi:hypothetical protein
MARTHKSTATASTVERLRVAEARKESRRARRTRRARNERWEVRAA